MKFGLLNIHLLIYTLNMKKAKIFKNGQSQAVRLPKEFRFNSKEVFIKKTKDGILLMDIVDPIEIMRKSISQFTDDYMSERIQPPPQAREEF
jgi:antitoxin VapB